MKIQDIMEADKRITPTKSIAPRPQKTLWFEDYDNWVRDLKHKYPKSEAHQTSDEQIVALNAEEDKCYGRWDPVDQKGVTYNKPRTIHSVVSTRTNTTKIPQTTNILRIQAHQ